MAIWRYHQPFRRSLGETFADDDHTSRIREILRPHGVSYVTRNAKLNGYVQYTLCDLILLIQVYYYRRIRQHRTASEATDTTPLIALSSATPQPKPLLPPSLEYPLLMIFILLSGVVAWYLSDSPDENSVPEKPGKGGDVELEWRSQVLGWMSAVLYLGSRVPQIAHNM